MKSKQLLAKILVFALAILVIGAVLTSCGDGKTFTGTLTVYVDEGGASPVAYTFKKEGFEAPEGLLSVLKALRDEEGLTLDLSGTFLTEIGNLSPDGSKNEYIQIFTSLKEDFDVSEWAAEYDNAGIHFCTAGVGIGEMKIKDGAAYYFRITSY